MMWNFEVQLMVNANFAILSTDAVNDRCRRCSLDSGFIEFLQSVRCTQELCASAVHDVYSVQYRCLCRAALAKCCSVQNSVHKIQHLLRS
jgi:hypothetical protein